MLSRVLGTVIQLICTRKQIIKEIAIKHGPGAIQVSLVTRLTQVKKHEKLKNERL